MNSLMKSAKAIQKRLLLCIGQTLKAFPEMWEMPYIEFYIELQKELKLTPGEDGAYKKVEHYIRSGLPLPDKFTNEVPITQEELHNAIKNIFASRAKKLQLDKKRIQGYSKINEHILNLIDEFYANIKLFEECMPFLTADFEKYLISHLIYREAWPPAGKPFTQEDRELLKEAMKSWPLKKIERNPQLNISEQSLYTLLSSAELLHVWAKNIERSQERQKGKSKRSASPKADAPLFFL